MLWSPVSVAATDEENQEKICRVIRSFYAGFCIESCAFPRVIGHHFCVQIHPGVTFPLTCDSVICEMKSLTRTNEESKGE